jgi:putative hemolysin
MSEEDKKPEKSTGDAEPAVENISADQSEEGASGQSDKEQGVVLPDRLEENRGLTFFLRQEHRFFYMALLLIILAVIGLGLLVRTQSVDLSRLTESVATLSHFVRSWTIPRAAEVTTTGERVYRRANQAWSYCQDQGGEPALAIRPDRTEYGLCLFGTDRQCEEWAMLKGKCPVGGIDITQYSHPADVYCVVTGNQIAPSLVPGRSGECVVGGERCDAEAFYETGQCQGN